MNHPDPTDGELALRECKGCKVLKHTYEFQNKSAGHWKKKCFQCCGSTEPDKIQVCETFFAFLLLLAFIFTVI